MALLHISLSVCTQDSAQAYHSPPQTLGGKMWNRLFYPLFYIVSPFHHMSKLMSKGSIDSTHEIYNSCQIIHYILCKIYLAFQHWVQQCKEFFYYQIGIFFSCMLFSTLCCILAVAHQHYKHRQGFIKLRLRFFRAIESSVGCTQKSCIVDTKLKWLLALSQAVVHSFSRVFQVSLRTQKTRTQSSVDLRDVDKEEKSI